MEVCFLSKQQERITQDTQSKQIQKQQKLFVRRNALISVSASKQLRSHWLPENELEHLMNVLNKMELDALLSDFGHFHHIFLVSCG
jgi:hypothetical protein